MTDQEILGAAMAYTDKHGGGGTTNYENLSNQPQVNGETLIGDKTGADLGLVDAVEGKGLSTNDYDDTEKAAVAAATSAISAMKDGTDLDSFGDVEVALLDKADTADLGTAAAKNSTNAVTSGSTDLVESGAVKDAIDAAVAAAYHHAGTKTVAQLTHDLLIASNEGNVYNITDSGTTTSDFIEGIGKTIDEGSNVGICKVGNAYMFDLLSGFVDTTNFVQKSQTAGLLKNDGTVNDEIEGDVATLKSGLTNLDNEVNGDATEYPYADVITIEDAVPANLAECNVKIEPAQSGSGDPSPTNIRPITGHTDVDVQRTGKNLFDKSAVTNGKVIDFSTGRILTNASYYTSDYIPVISGDKYTFSGVCLKNSSEQWWYDKDKQPLQVANNNTTKIVPNGAYYFRFSRSISDGYVGQIEKGSTATPYEPYQGKTYIIVLGDTIYGGILHIDNKGNVELLVDRVSVDMGTLPWGADGQNMFRANISGAKTYSRNILPPWKCEVYPTKAQDDISGPCISSTNWTSAVCLWNSGYSDAASVTTALSGKLLVYELATPFIVSLSSEQIQLLKGTNTITASTGDISVTVNGVSGAIGQVQEQVNDHEERIGSLESVDLTTSVIAGEHVTIDTTTAYVIKVGGIVVCMFSLTANQNLSSTNEILITNMPKPSKTRLVPISFGSKQFQCSVNTSGVFKLSYSDDTLQLGETAKMLFTYPL